ncbi:IS3 family transposase [Microbacterium indicum]|uniref:IS3 family transposase n=1 Tax=Microbacterium indicum TaxID=358100 RepID=UPI000A03683D
MTRSIDLNHDRLEVELICRIRRGAVKRALTSRGYRAAKTRVASARQLRDELLIPEIPRLHTENYGVYGRRKMHVLLQRQGWAIGRDQTERLMKLAGVTGVNRSAKTFTTRADPAGSRPSDLVQRRFTADAPRHLWAADIT